jgi:hypothetical protein
MDEPYERKLINEFTEIVKNFSKEIEKVKEKLELIEVMLTHPIMEEIPKPDPPKNRSIILRNAAKCRKCGDIIESKHRHDFVTCKCGAISLDGGRSYFRVVWPEGNCEDYVEDLSESKEISEEEYQKMIKERKRIPIEVETLSEFI